MHRAEPRAEKLDDDYFVIIKRFRPYRTSNHAGWTWEVRRRSMPMGVKYRGVQYASPDDARLAGETALKDFLSNSSQPPFDRPAPQ
jgi:hypothetical protein